MAQLALAVIIFDQKMVFCRQLPEVWVGRGHCPVALSTHITLLCLSKLGFCPEHLAWDVQGAVLSETMLETMSPSWPSATPVVPLMLPRPGLQHWRDPSLEFLWKHQKGKMLRTLAPGKKGCSLWRLWAASLPVVKLSLKEVSLTFPFPAWQWLSPRSIPGLSVPVLNQPYREASGRTFKL